MRHDVIMPIQDDPGRAFTFALAVLTAAGFRIASRTPNGAELRGPGMSSSRQSPLRGATVVRLELQDGSLHLDAELGGVEWMRRFLFWFPTGLCLFLGVTLSAILWAALGPGRWLYIVVAIVVAYDLLWKTIGPFIAHRIEARTRADLDTIVLNAAALGAESPAST